ncbi:ubiquitin carboxyl-terminal hydrolase 37-like isoform X1 [Thunnus maccoyii]|uniref:ubiquitin carboxyl-terminal hydrolase 37-like isoform X1 n=1 Tax=Thunnus maccoyii TaxID=8240 RepID=UPI001C4AD5D0|nr:ubiquitin carboxyl-terminal hydrolase 37-like isoform X1 [Thunnus maccoyii]
MFKMPRCLRKKNQVSVVEDESQLCSISSASSQKSSVEKPPGRTPWLHRLFGRPVFLLSRQKSEREREERGQRSGHQQRVTSSDAPANQQPEKKTRWRCRVFDCCRRNRRVAPAADDQGDDGEQRIPQKPQRSPVKATDGTLTADEVDEVVEFDALTEEEEEAVTKTEKKAANRKHELHRLTSFLLSGYRTLANQDSSSNSAKTHHVRHGDVMTSQRLRGQQVDWFGFPNPAQICYMNSSLQSLFTLKDFITDIMCQVEVWGSVPQAELIRRLMNITLLHRSVDVRDKLQALFMFKSALSVQAQEFQDFNQKDAHELLTTLLDQMRSLSPALQEAAARVGRSYRCPVEDHFEFQMKNTRICKRCGARTTREEDFNNLSLDLVPGASVQQMLQDYLKETDLDFRCDCGANTSGQQSTFVNLPKVLMLHLKRFSFTPFLQLEKLRHPVELFRELLVTSSQADGWYSLVSVISHLGSGGEQGHYISDGVHPDVELDDLADRWLIYNDSEVTETKGASVCERRQRDAYILFYQRRM